MKLYSDSPNQFIDLTKLADDVVLGLSSIERGSKVPPELLEKGIELCEYLLYLVEGLKAAEFEKERLPFHSVRDDREALRESRIDIDREYTKTEEVKNWIGDLIDNPSSHTREEIEVIKEHLMTLTMPIWQKRTSEFRERKMKRSLIVHV